MSLEFIARHDRVVMEEIDISDRVSNGVFISDNGEERADCYKVVSVGPGFTNPHTGFFTPTQFQVGDEVYVKKAFIHQVQISGKTFFVTRDAEILGYVKEINDSNTES